MPASTVLDLFNGADNDALTTHTPDLADLSWTTHASWGNACTIYGNRARQAQYESVAYLSLAVPSRASEAWGVEAPVYYAAAQTGAYGGVWAGVTGAKTGYVVYWYGGYWELYKYVAGVGSSLGTWTGSFSVGDTKTVRMRFTSTQVIVSIDGTDRITATDSSITPTRLGVYGARGGIDTDKGFFLSDISVVGRAYLRPATETNAAVALVAAQVSRDKYAQVTAKITGLGGTPTVERGPDGSTWSDVSSAGYISRTGSGPHTVVDKRPHYGSGSVAYDSTIYYRFSYGGTSMVVSTAASVDADAVIQAQLEAARTYRNGLGTDYVPTSSELQPGQWLMTDAYGFWKYTDAGWSNASDHLTHCQDQWDYIKSLAQTGGPASGILCLDGVTTVVETDAHFRPIMHTLECVRLLRRTGDATAETLADDMVATCNTWAKNGIDKLPQSSKTYAGWDANAQTAWAGTTAYAVGALVRPTTGNGRSYRCYTAGTSSGSEPTWPTTAGGTVTDGSVTWKETTRTHDRFAHLYTVSFTISPSSWALLPNKEVATAAALALLMIEPDATDFYIGGSYRTTAQSIIDAALDTVCSCFSLSDGALPYSDGTSGIDTTHDTLYGAFCSSTIATIQHIGLTADWQVGPMLNKTLDWLESGTYATEPLTAEHRSGLGAGITPGGDVALRFAAYSILDRVNPLDRIIYAACFNDPASDYPTEYTANGGGTAYASGASLMDIFDGITLDESIISQQFVTLTPTTETDAAVTLTHARGLTLTAAVETDTAVALEVNQPQSITLIPALETDSAVALSFASGSQYVGITPATEGDAAVALSYGFAVPQEVTLTPATESDAAVTLRITRSGSFAMNMQMAPGTVVGAYLRHEWIGSEVPVRGTGSYPGVAVTTATVDDYGEVEFTGLDVGSYIAWAEDYPLRRRFFVMTG